MGTPEYLLTAGAGACVVLVPGIAMVLWAVRKIRAIGLRGWVPVVAGVSAIAIATAVVFIGISFVLETREVIYRVKPSDALASKLLGVSVVLLVAMIVTFVISGSALVASLVRRSGSWRLFFGAQVLLSMAYAAFLFRLVMVY